MNVIQQKQGNLTIISIEGNIVLEETAEVQKLVTPHIEDLECHGIIFDCGKVKYMDSSGLGMIVSIYKTLRKQEKGFALSNINSNVLELFSLTKLDQILTITKDLESAIQKLK